MRLVNIINHKLLNIILIPGYTLIMFPFIIVLLMALADNPYNGISEYEAMIIMVLALLIPIYTFIGIVNYMYFKLKRNKEEELEEEEKQEPKDSNNKQNNIEYLWNILFYVIPLIYVGFIIAWVFF